MRARLARHPRATPLLITDLGPTSAVEIGTGYFVNKTIVEAQAFLQRKMDFLKKQIAEISKKLDEDVRNLEQVSLVIRQKGGQI